MLSTLVNTVAVVVALATPHVAAQLQILTPVLTQCQDAVISYSGGQPNYGLYVLPSGNPCADSVVTIPEQTGTSYKWKVNLPAGSQVELMVEDSALAEAWSGVVTVQNSNDASCVDAKATQALIASNSFQNSSSSAASSIIPSSDTPHASSPIVKISTAPSLSSPSGVSKSVIPVAQPSGLANAAGSGATSQENSGLPRAALPVCSLLGIAAFFFTLVHLP